MCYRKIRPKVANFPTVSVSHSQNNVSMSPMPGPFAHPIKDGRLNCTVKSSLANVKLLQKFSHEYLVFLGHNCGRKTMQLCYSLCKYRGHHLNCKRCFKPRKCAYLDSLSTTTNTVSKPSDFGSFSIKSIVMSFQTCCGIGKGCRKPCCFWWEAFFSVGIPYTLMYVLSNLLPPTFLIPILRCR